MTKSNNNLSFVIATAILTFIIVGCGSTNQSPPTANTATVNKADAGPSPASEPPSKTAPIAGDYTVTGKNVDGAGDYTGSLTITPRDDVFQFSWSSGGRTYDGVGVQTGDIVAVSFTEGENGKGCGVVLYKIGTDGSLDGKAGYWGVNKAEFEKAKRISGSDLEGKYEASGKSPDGKAYSLGLSIAKDGDGYSFRWGAPPSELKGFGIRMGDMSAVGFGGQQCGFVMYEVTQTGTLEGKWGGQGSTRFGTEIAKKK